MSKNLISKVYLKAATPLFQQPLMDSSTELSELRSLKAVVVEFIKIILLRNDEILKIDRHFASKQLYTNV